MESIGVKNELFINYEPLSYCHACLCTDREFSPVTKYVDIYYKICDNQITVPPDKIYLCWECMALLKKIRLFTIKVAEAQKMLRFYYTNKQNFPRSLSNLVIYHATDKEITVINKDNDIKPVKQDPEQFEDYSENFDYTEGIKDEPNESEQLTEIEVDTKIHVPDIAEPSKSDWKKKRVMNRRAKYRFLNIKLKKHRRLLVKRIPIKLNEVLSGLEMERCDDMFVKEAHKCVSCVAFWSDEDGAVKHHRKWHDQTIGPYTCNICQIHCLSPDKLRSHESKHYYLRECKVCQFVCYSQGVMDRHLEEHHRMAQCIACELCFKNVRLFYNHYKALHGCYVCDVCGKRCKSRAIIEKHLRYHFGYECPYCKKKLKNSSSYKNHVESQHSSSVSDDSYCVQCDRRFTNGRMYKRHLQASAAHARERDNTGAKRKYPCPECSNVYSRRTYMNNHYRHVHSKQSKYYCEDCDRHFLNRTRFIDHRRFQHEGAKRDKDKLCNICGRGFAANRTLINHIRTHSGERPFACEYCGAKFTQKHAMLSHVKYIHLKSKRKSSWHE